MQKQNNIQRIEMFGYPGCGKTTALQVVQKSNPDFEARKANVSFNIKNTLSVLVFTLSRPYVFKSFGLLRYVPLSKWILYFKTIIRFYLRVMFMRKSFNKGENIIVDEGMIQITWSLLLFPTIYGRDFNLDSQLNKVIERWWPKDKMLIYYIELSDEEYLRRVKARQRKHFFSMAYVNNDIRFKGSGKELTSLILDRARQVYTVRKYM